MAATVNWAGESAAMLCLCLGVLAGPAASQPTEQQQNAIRQNCRSDYMANCSSVTPGGAEALQCLRRNAAKLSPACQSALNAVTPASPPPSSPPPAQAMPAPTTPPPAGASPP